MKFWKDVIAPGSYLVRGKHVLNVSDKDVKHWADTFGRMKDQKIKVPVPWEHPDIDDENGKPVEAGSPREKARDAARLNAGWVEEMKVDDDGRLMALLDIRKEEDAESIKSVGGFVSPEIVRSYVDSRGNAWNQAITHVALTPRPVIQDQSDQFVPHTDAVMALSQIEGDSFQLSLANAVQLSSGKGTRHAPAGGINVAGKHFKGGRFIPNEAVEGLNSKELKKLDDEIAEAKSGSSEAEERKERAKKKAKASSPGKPKKLEDGRYEYDGVSWDKDLLDKTIPAKPGNGEEIALSKSEYQWLLENAKTAHISAGLNPNLEYWSDDDDVTPEGKRNRTPITRKEVAERHEKLKSMLVNQGYKFMQGVGNYGDLEDTIIAFIPNAERKKVSEMGHALNQDSILLSEKGKAQIVYTTGPNVGKATDAVGLEFDESAEEYYSQVSFPSPGGEGTDSSKYRFLVPDPNWSPENMSPRQLSRSEDEMLTEEKEKKEYEDETDASNGSEMFSSDSDESDADTESSDDDVDGDGIDDDDQDGIPAEGEDDSESNSKVISELAELGVIVPEGTKLKGDLNTLMAAIMTYKAANAKGGEDAESDDAGGDDMDSSMEDEEQPTVLNLSQAANENPALAAILEQARADRVSNYNSRIDKLVGSGRCTAKLAKEMRGGLESFQLSLDGEDDGSDSRIDIQLSTLEELPEGSVISTEEQTGENMTEFYDVKMFSENPDGALSEEETKEIADKLLGVPREIHREN